VKVGRGTIKGDGEGRVGEGFTPATAISTTLSVPSSDGANIGFGLQDCDQLAVNLVLGAKLEPLHASDDLSIEFVHAKGFPMDEMGVGWSAESTDHPWVLKYLGQ
jgi:hypothetical protein